MISYEWYIVNVNGVRTIELRVIGEYYGYKDPIIAGPFTRGSEAMRWLEDNSG